MAARKKSLPLSKVYQLLEPGPVIMLSTHHKGQDNVMTMSWLTMMEFEPPLIGCVLSEANYSFQMLKASGECVINVPTAAIAKKVVGCGNTTGSDSDKFEKFKLTKSKGSQVKAPLIDECYASIECRVSDTRMVKKYNFFVLEAVKAWWDPKIKNPKTIHHHGRGHFTVTGRQLSLKSRMK